ncbi:MAG: hypothetical protein AAB938_01080 [Patescibacteria group bacterium]
MGKRGVKPKGKVKIQWSHDFAYAVGLLATDGCLSGTKRHVVFVSKDLEQIKNFLKAFKIKDIKIGKTFSGYDRNMSYRVQFGDVLFYNFLLSIGITSAKSKTIGAVKIPDKYFFDFLRGCLDGDGTFYSYWDPRWKSSFMFYTEFVSASQKHVLWLQKQISHFLGVWGHMTKARKGSVYQLKYAKKDSIKILSRMYRKKDALFLKRKKLKIDKALGIIGKRL